MDDGAKSGLHCRVSDACAAPTGVVRYGTSRAHLLMHPIHTVVQRVERSVAFPPVLTHEGDFLLLGQLRIEAARIVPRQWVVERVAVCVLSLRSRRQQTQWIGAEK